VASLDLTDPWQIVSADEPLPEWVTGEAIANDYFRPTSALVLHSHAPEAEDAINQCYADSTFEHMRPAPGMAFWDEDGILQGEVDLQAVPAYARVMHRHTLSGLTWRTEQCQPGEEGARQAWLVTVREADAAS
jgi:hypothetical protein